MVIVATALVSVLIGAGVAALIAVTSRAVEKSVHAREVGLLGRLLEIERERTGDLLTRLSARSVAEYRAVVAPANTPAATRTYVTDPTGLIVADADDDTNIVA